MRFTPTLAAFALIATPALAQQGGGMGGHFYPFSITRQTHKIPVRTGSSWMSAH